MGAPEVFPFDLAPTWNDDGSLALLESFPGPSEAQPSKRQRFEAGEASVEAYMAQLGAAPELPHGEEAGSPGAALRTRSLPYSDDLDDEPQSAGPSAAAGSRMRRETHSGGGPPVANPSKAHRERARRERLNDGFSELAGLLDPGKAVRTDKLSIIADAVKEVTKLRAESHQLRQLNKFLEDRVRDLETAKNQAELARMMQAQLAGGGANSQFPLQQQQQQQQQQQPQPHHYQQYGQQQFYPGVSMAGGMIAVPAAALQQLGAMSGAALQPGGAVSGPMAQSVSHINLGAALLQQSEGLLAQQPPVAADVKPQPPETPGGQLPEQQQQQQQLGPEQQAQQAALQQQASPQMQLPKYPSGDLAATQNPTPQQQQQHCRPQPAEQQQQQAEQQQQHVLPGDEQQQMQQLWQQVQQQMTQAQAQQQAPDAGAAISVGAAGVQPQQPASSGASQAAAGTPPQPHQPSPPQPFPPATGAPPAGTMWLAPSELDTSQDHMRRPPAA